VSIGQCLSLNSLAEGKQEALGKFKFGSEIECEHTVSCSSLHISSAPTACYRSHQPSVTCVLALILSTGSVCVCSLLFLLEVFRCLVWLSPATSCARIEPTPAVLIPSLTRVYYTNREGIIVMNSFISGWGPVTGFCCSDSTKAGTLKITQEK
jgi:hypothetical protein